MVSYSIERIANARVETPEKVFSILSPGGRIQVQPQHRHRVHMLAIFLMFATAVAMVGCVRKDSRVSSTVERGAASAGDTAGAGGSREAGRSAAPDQGGTATQGGAGARTEGTAVAEGQAVLKNMNKLPGVTVVGARVDRDGSDRTLSLRVRTQTYGTRAFIPAVASLAKQADAALTRAGVEANAVAVEVLDKSGPLVRIQIQRSDVRQFDEKAISVADFFKRWKMEYLRPLH